MNINQKLKNLKRKSIKHISINVGYKCNQFCSHCHLEAGPQRKEVMETATVHSLIVFIKKIKPESIEITGGAPELMPDLILLLKQLKHLVKEISMRTNLTLLHLPQYYHIMEYIKEENMELVASLPCYTREKVDSQRGNGVFKKSINNLRLLNKFGFGSKHGKILSLVYNPIGEVIPPPQSCLEQTYREKLEAMGIYFNNLYAMTNVALGKFKKNLIKNNKYGDYMGLLSKNFNSSTIHGLMCLNQITVDWKGNIYDCDFNLAANLPCCGFSSIDNISLNSYIGRPIHIEEHCLACTAGSGSSCHGELK